MTVGALDIGWTQAALELAIVSAAVIPFCDYAAKIYTGSPTTSTTVFARFERLIYRMGGVDAEVRMDWKTYTLAALTFSALSFLVLYLILISQGWLPINSAHLAGLSPEQAFSKAASFIANADLKPNTHAPISLFSQSVGLTVQTFLSAAVGICVLVAVARGLAPQSSVSGIGNFWVDLVRTNLYVLLPLSLILSGLVGTAGVTELVETGRAFQGIGGDNLQSTLNSAIADQTTRLTTSD